MIGVRVVAIVAIAAEPASRRGHAQLANRATRLDVGPNAVTDASTIGIRAVVAGAGDGVADAGRTAVGRGWTCHIRGELACNRRQAVLDAGVVLTEVAAANRAARRVPGKPLRHAGTRVTARAGDGRPAWVPRGPGTQPWPARGWRMQFPASSHVPDVAVHPSGLGSEQGLPTFVGVIWRDEWPRRTRRSCTRSHHTAAAR